MQTKALVDTVRTIAEKVQTFYNTLGEVKPKVLVNKLAARIAVQRVRTI